MFLRISSAAIIVASLVACGANETPPPKGDPLECAIGAGSDFGADCKLEWLGEEWGSDFLIHHPDGGFRRFSYSENASGVIVQDGAEEVEMLNPAPDSAWQFSVAGDRYRMPAPPPLEV